MIEWYYDQRDAREALRESGEYMRHEDYEFDEERPKVTFKIWLMNYWRR